MRRVAVLVLTVTCCLGLTNRGIAGPFGLSMGMKPAEVGGKLEKAEGAPGRYLTEEVPTPHSAFARYGLIFGPTTGLCVIVALSNLVETSAYGTELMRAFDQMEERLSSQYGKHHKIDVLGPGSLWKDPQDFMMGLLKKERTLMTSWVADPGATLKDSLVKIQLRPQGLSQENGLLSVRYAFQNTAQCRKELHAAEDDAL